MGIVTAFLLGYVVGANAGREGYEDVVAAARALKESPEFDGLLQALRSHASSTLADLADRLAANRDRMPAPLSLLDRVQDIVGRPTSPGS